MGARMCDKGTCLRVTWEVAGRDAVVKAPGVTFWHRLGSESTLSTQCYPVWPLQTFAEENVAEMPRPHPHPPRPAPPQVISKVGYVGHNIFQLDNPSERLCLSPFLNLTLVGRTHRILSTYQAGHFGAATWQGLYSLQGSEAGVPCTATGPYGGEGV